MSCKIHAAPGRSFYRRVIDLITQIPRGKVSTYGQIAAYAGNSRAARQVAFILHASSGKYNLPWHRVVNSRGCISLKPGHGYELQRSMLVKEGITFDRRGRIDLKKYLWLS